MDEVAKEKKARRKAKQASKKTARKPRKARKSKESESEEKLTPTDLIKPAIEKVETFEGSSEEFEKFVYQVLDRKSSLLKKNTHPNWKANPIEGLEGSEELCDAVMKKKNEILKAEAEKRKEEKNQKRLRASLKELLS
jgi:hypothetical protein